MEIAILLHNVRSTHNVGSIFRTADAAGVSKVYLSGFTPAPIDRFGRPQKEIAKTALGAEQFIPWQKSASAESVIATLRKSGWRIVGVEQDPRSKDYRKLKPKGRVLYVFGNEVRGLSPKLRERCDTLIEIPMRGKKESLNVAVAAGVILFSARS
ncbi:MAG: RNA methyltransferase [Candidatus Kaiserbacteria bacterium]|nr:MAG: RNA methyltransferase [Candidatus Kaiserbacteria bacterium]